MKTFRPEQFVATQWDGPADKAQFANHFVRFVESGFKRSLFHKRFYTRLSMMFGFIAHFNVDGFYATYFVTTAGRLAFVRACVTHPPYGDPAWTFSDVERELRSYLRESRVLEAVEHAHASAVEAAERAEYARLHAKYGPAATAA